MSIKWTCRSSVLSIKRSVDRLAVDKPAVDKLAVDKPAVDKLGVDKLSVDKPYQTRISTVRIHSNKSLKVLKFFQSLETFHFYPFYL
jgi:hypothetical protein